MGSFIEKRIRDDIMKILLIDPPQREIYGNLKNVFSKHPNLGLMHLSAVLKKNNHEVKLIDPELQNINMENLKRLIEDFKPEIVGFSSMTSTIPWVFKVSTFIKSLHSKIITVLGGYHGSALPKETLKECSGLDVVVVGEGEYTLVELADRITKKKIKGNAFRDGKKIIMTSPRKLLLDLDSLPLPDFDCLPLIKYKPHSHRSNGMKWTCVTFSRGCPYNCYYCASKIINHQKYRKHSVDRVIKIFSELRKRGFRYFRIIDDEFTLDKRWVT